MIQETNRRLKDEEALETDRVQEDDNQRIDPSVHSN